MAISVFQVQSPLSQVTRERTNEYLKTVGSAVGEELVRVDLDEFEKAPFALVFVASGGSEGIFKEGYERIAGAMAALRSDTPREFAGVAVDRFEDMRSGKAMDYAAKKETESEVTGMNAVRFLLSDGAWICVRPSGTEPKLKLYIGANAKTDEEVEALLKG